MVSHGVEVAMFESLLGEDPLSVVEHQHLAEQVECVLAAEGLVVGFDELGPGFGWGLAQKFVELLVQLNVVLFEVLEQALGAQYLADLDQLVTVAIAHEEWFFFEDLVLGWVLPWRRTWRLLTRYPESSRSSCSRPAARVL